ncbi:response regulator [Vibrio parahaemolyticus VPCR-2010]|uniref:response regulator n=1 Tax=Vibrio parahaemolyticus TaxID=670 RepID=UPI00038E5D95|nr:response regulator [Vibrio parahaemolyticus VPCR-2010]
MHKFSAEDANKLKVLILDSSEFTQAIIRKNCYTMGIHNVTLASSPDKAARIFKKQKFNLVIIDFDSELKDNYVELFKHIRESNTKVCTVFISSNHTKRNIAEMIQIEAEDIILKPFTLKVLSQRIFANAQNIIMTSKLRKLISEGNHQEVLESIYELEKHFNTGQIRGWLYKVKIQAMLELKMYKNIESFCRFLLVNNEAEWIRTYLAESLMATRRYKEALQEVLICKRKHPSSIKATLLLGDIYDNLGNTDEAYKCYKEVTGCCPDYIKACLAISKIDAKKMKYEQAIDSYEKIISLLEKRLQSYPDIYVEMANLKRDYAESKIKVPMIDAIKESIKYLNRGYENFPESKVIHVNQALFKVIHLHEAGENQKALNLLNRTYVEHKEFIENNSDSMISIMFLYLGLCHKDMANNLVERMKMKMGVHETYSQIRKKLEEKNARRVQLKNYVESAQNEITELIANDKLYDALKKIDDLLEKKPKIQSLQNLAVKISYKMAKQYNFNNSSVRECMRCIYRAEKHVTNESFFSSIKSVKESIQKRLQVVAA